MTPSHALHVAIDRYNRRRRSTCLVF